MQLPFEQFPALSAIGICRHVFTQRIPGIDVSHDKAEALKRLGAAHREIRNAIGVGDWPLLTAQQIHGNKIAIIDSTGRVETKNSPGAMVSLQISAGSRLAFMSPTAARFTLSIQRHPRSGSFILVAKALS